MTTDLAEVLARPWPTRGNFTPQQRLERKSRIDPDGCWTWLGCVNSRGYGCIGINGSTVLVHRLAHHVLVGPIPDGLVVDHRCHNEDRNCPGGNCAHRRCWRPDHLEPVSASDNRDRAYRKSNIPPLVWHGPNPEPDPTEALDWTVRVCLSFNSLPQKDSPAWHYMLANRETYLAYYEECLRWSDKQRAARGGRVNHRSSA